MEEIDLDKDLGEDRDKEGLIPLSDFEKQQSDQQDSFQANQFQAQTLFTNPGTDDFAQVNKISEMLKGERSLKQEEDDDESTIVAKF